MTSPSPLEDRTPPIRIPPSVCFASFSSLSAFFIYFHQRSRNCCVVTHLPLQKLLRSHSFAPRTGYAMIISHHHLPTSPTPLAPFLPHLLHCFLVYSVSGCLLSCCLNYGFLSTLKMGLGVSRTTADSQWNPFTRHFIEFNVVQTKQFVGSNVNVILTRQTCGQRSSRAAVSKRQALEIDFSERLSYMFPISKCRED